MPSFKIYEFERFQNEINIVPNHYVELVTVPPDLPLRHEARRFYDDRSIDAPITRGSIWLRVGERPDSYIIAQAVFSADEEHVTCDNIDVLSPSNRRKGIATALFDFAEKYFQLPATPSPILSPEAKEFWANRLKKVV